MTKSSSEDNNLSRDAVHNPAVVNIDSNLEPCCIEVLHSMDTAKADCDDPAAEMDDAVDKKDRILILLQYPSFLLLPGPVLEQFGVSDPLSTVHQLVVPDSSRFLVPEDIYFDSY